MKIAIVDDHILFRDGLKSILPQKDYEIVMEAENGRDLINKLQLVNEENFPEIFIIDISMPLMDGFETVQWLKTKYLNAKIIILTFKDDEESIIRMIKLGVKSYLSKACTKESLLKAINTVSNNGVFFPDEITLRIVNSIVDTSNRLNKNTKLSDLTEREIQFLKLLASEMTGKEIAEKLGVSARTVEGYKESLLVKLNLNSRMGLVMYAIKSGLITL